MSEPQSHGAAEAQLHDPHAVPHDAAHFHNHARLYAIIGAILLFCTALTVGLSYVDFGSREANIVVAILLAAFKATLVALIFMHLKQEKKTIYQFMLVTCIFVIGLFGLSILGFFDHIFL